MVSLPTVGYWKLLSSSDKINSFPELDHPDIEEIDTCTEIIKANNISGEGSGCIYVYYFPAYFKDNDSFPIKIGMSSGDYRSRILSQIGTSSPEYPVVYRVLLTDTPTLIESYIHSALKVQDKWIVNSPGNEWFMTTPKEIDDLLRIAGKLL